MSSRCYVPAALLPVSKPPLLYRMWSHVTVSCHVAWNCAGVVFNDPAPGCASYQLYRHPYLWDTCRVRELLHGHITDDEVVEWMGVTLWRNKSHVEGAVPFVVQSFGKGYEFTSQQVCRPYKFPCGCFRDNAWTRVLRLVTRRRYAVRHAPSWDVPINRQSTDWQLTD